MVSLNDASNAVETDDVLTAVAMGIATAHDQFPRPPSPDGRPMRPAKSMEVPLLARDFVHRDAGAGEMLDLMPNDRLAGIHVRHARSGSELQMIRATMQAPGQPLEQLGLGRGKALGHGAVTA